MKEVFDRHIPKITCTTAFVEDKHLYVDGKLLPLPDDILIVLPEQSPDKIFMVLGHGFAKEFLSPIMVEVEKIRASSISLVSNDQRKIELFWEEVKDQYFPYVIALNDKNIFLPTMVGGFSAIKAEEYPSVPSPFETALFASLTTSMIDPYLDYCGPSKRSILRKMHEGAIEAILKQPCMIFSNEEKLVGFLSWKTDLTWKEPTIVSTHYVGGSLTSRERSFIHSKMFSKLQSFKEVKAARIHARNSNRECFSKRTTMLRTSFFSSDWSIKRRFHERPH